MAANTSTDAILRILADESIDAAAKREQLNEVVNGEGADSLVDALWCLTSLYTDDYIDVLNEVLNDSKITDHTVLTRMNLQILKRSNKFNKIDPAKINKQMIRHNTNLLYRQKKFNLFREESEGWAKLLRNLCAGEKTGGLIGVFELDPCRVTDCMFGALVYRVGINLENKADPEANLENQIESLRELKHIQHLIGLTLPTHDVAFYYTVAILVKNNIVDLDQLMPHFLSDMDELVQKTNEHYTELIKILKKFGPSSKIPNETHDLDHPILLLLGVLLDLGCCDVAHALLRRVYAAKIDPLICNTGLMAKARKFLTRLVEEIYTPPPNTMFENEDGEVKDIESKENYSSTKFTALMNFLFLTQHTFIMQDQQTVFYKILSASQSYIQHQSSQDDRMKLFKMLLYILNTVPNPSNDSSCSIQIHATLWDMIRNNMAWRERYALYADAWEWGSISVRDLQSHVMKKYLIAGSNADLNKILPRVDGDDENKKWKPMSVLQTLITSSYQASYILKRTSRENVHTMVPKLAKMAALTSPLSTIKVLMSIVGNYENMGELMLRDLNGLSYWGRLGCDVVTYEFRCRLEQNKAQSAGLQVFMSSFYHVCSELDVELDGVLEFVCHDIRQANVGNVELLRGLLSVAGGMPSWGTQSTEKLFARAGGSHLQSKTVSFGKTGKAGTNSKSQSNLRTSLMPYGIRISVRLAHLRNVVIFTDKGNLSLCDNVTSLLFMLVEFLQQDSSGWAKLFEGRENLDDCKLDKNILFALIRPMLGAQSTLSPSSGDVVEELFYRYSLGDIHCPEDLYDDEIKNPSTSSSEAASLEKERDVCGKHVKSIRNHVLKKLSEENASFDVDKFLSGHILPRAILTSSDAIYCSKFLQLLLDACTHMDDLSVTLYEKLLSYIRAFLYSMTEEEGGNLGLFLYDTWQLLSSWRYGSSSGARNTDDTAMETDDSTECKLLDAEKYDEWHTKLACSLILALQSKEELISRTALKVLIRMVSVFPTKGVVGGLLLKKLQPIQTDEGSNKALANSYFGQLTRARFDGVWKEGDFRAEAERMEQEKAKQDDRREKLRLQDEALAAEVAQYDKLNPDKREWDRNRGPPRSERDRDRGGDRDRRIHVGAPTFVPRGGVSGDSSRGGGGPPPAGLEGRWQKGSGLASVGDKRSRTPPPPLDDSGKRTRAEDRGRGGSSGGYRDRGRGGYR